MYFVYLLYSKKLDQYYIGFTSTLVEERLNKHLSNHKGFTSRAKDWVVVFKESHQNKEDALRREKEIKNWKSRIKIEILLKTNGI
jgi:putative endonuclease